MVSQSRWVGVAMGMLATGLVPAAVQAAYVAGDASSPIILTDDFEAPVSGATGYNLGESPVDIGPWGGTSGTTGNNYTQTVASNGGQAMKVVAKYSGGTNINYYAPQHPHSSYVEFDLNPGTGSYAGWGNNTNQTWSMRDSGGAKLVLSFGITGPGADQPNKIYVETPVGRTYYQTVDGSKFLKINIQLSEVNATVKDWSYNLWVDNQLLTGSPVAFSTAGNGAGQADYGQFSFGWQGDATPQIDNFSWRTDAFTREVPEPASLGLLGLGGACVLGRRVRSDR